MKRGKFSLSYTNCCRVTWVSLSRSAGMRPFLGTRCSIRLQPLFVLRLYFLQSCILLRYAFTIGSFRTGFSGIIGRISLLVVLTVWTLLSILLLPFRLLLSALWPTIWGFQLRLTPSVFRPFRLEPMRQSSTRNYRDQDLVTLAALSLGDGVDATTSTALKNIAWEKDSYTSARPWEQKGPR